MLVPKLDEQGKEVLDEQGKVVMVEDGKSKVHSDDAFRAVSDDMHKYKKAQRAAELENEKLKKQIDDSAKDKLIAKEQYKELYDSEVSRTTELEKKLSENTDKFINVHKKQAVIDKLGGFRRTEYNKFIDTSKIIVDDNGNVDEITVDVEVKRLKQEYPELLKRSKGGILPNNAPESGDPIGSKSFNKMTKEEKSQTRLSLLEDRYKDTN